MSNKIENYLFVKEILETKKYDHLFFDAKTRLWHLSKQPNIMPSSYQVVNFCDFSQLFVQSYAVNDWQYGSYISHLIEKLKYSLFNRFFFDYKLNSWVANSDSNSKVSLSSNSFINLLTKL